MSTLSETLRKIWPNAPAIGSVVCKLLSDNAICSFSRIEPDELVKIAAEIGYLVGRNEADFDRFMRELQLRFFSS